MTNSITVDESQLESLNTSPTDFVNFYGKEFFIKRDDLLSEKFSGNKARKFYHFLVHNYPSVRKLVAYGSPQANSLVRVQTVFWLRFAST